MSPAEIKARFPNASESLMALNGSPHPAAAVSEDADFRQPENAFIGAEKLLHRDFQTDMERRGVHVIHARTDRESTIAAGCPDFHLLFTGADGITRGCAVEFKCAGGVVKANQREVIRDMRKKGIPTRICWTLKDAIFFAKEQLGC